MLIIEDYQSKESNSDVLQILKSYSLELKTVVVVPPHLKYSAKSDAGFSLKQARHRLLFVNCLEFKEFSPDVPDLLIP